MGVIKEEVDDACKLKNINLDTLQSYWEDKSKTEQEKITEVENFVKPFFTEAKTYMLKYIDSDWFNKKVQEKIGKGSKFNTENFQIFGINDLACLLNYIFLYTFYIYLIPSF